MPKRRILKQIARRKSAPPGVPLPPPLWLVTTRQIEQFYEEHHESVHERAGRLKEERARRGYDVISWQWTGSGAFINNVKLGERIIEFAGDAEPVRVYEPQTVLEVECRKHKGRRVTYLQLEYRVRERSFTLKSFAKHGSRLGVHIAKHPQRLIRDAGKAHALRQLFIMK